MFVNEAELMITACTTPRECEVPADAEDTVARGFKHAYLVLGTLGSRPEQ